MDLALHKQHFWEHLPPPNQSVRVERGGVKTSGEVGIRLPWPCSLGGVLIHLENKLLSHKRMTAFGTSQMLPFMC